MKTLPVTLTSRGCWAVSSSSELLIFPPLPTSFLNCCIHCDYTAAGFSLAFPLAAHTPTCATILLQLTDKPWPWLSIHSLSRHPWSCHISAGLDKAQFLPQLYSCFLGPTLTTSASLGNPVNGRDAGTLEALFKLSHSTILFILSFPFQMADTLLHCKDP